MTIKYRRKGNSWAYIEAPYMTVAKLIIPWDGNDQSCTSDEADRITEKRYEEMNSAISKQTEIDVDHIRYLVYGRVCNVDYCTVVVASTNPEITTLVAGEPHPVAYVLNTEAYLLNSAGKTIERIA